MKKRITWPCKRVDLAGLYFLTYLSGALVVALSCLPNLKAAGMSLALFPMGLVNLCAKVASNTVAYAALWLYPILATLGIVTRSRTVYALFVILVVVNIGGCFAGPS